MSRSIEIEGRRYRLLKRQRHGRRREVVVFEPDGLRYRDNVRLCDARSKRHFNPIAFRRTLRDGVPEELLEISTGAAFRKACKVRGLDPDPRHFRLCEDFAQKPTAKCYHHGGSSLKGAAQPRAKDLSTSRYAAGTAHRLGQQLEAFQELEEPEDLATEIALQRAVLADAWDQLGDVDLVAIRKKIEQRLDAADRLLAGKKYAKVRAELVQLRELISKGSIYREASRAIGRAQLGLARLQRAQIARRKHVDEVVTRQDLDNFELRITAATRRLVKAIVGTAAPNSALSKRARKALSEWQVEVARAGGRLDE